MIIPQALFFNLRRVLTMWDLIWFPANFRVFFSVSVKNVFNIFFVILLILLRLLQLVSL